MVDGGRGGGGRKNQFIDCREDEGMKRWGG